MLIPVECNSAYTPLGSCAQHIIEGPPLTLSSCLQMNLDVVSSPRVSTGKASTDMVGTRRCNTHAPGQSSYPDGALVPRLPLPQKR